MDKVEDSGWFRVETNQQLKIATHSFPAWRSALRDSVKSNPASLLAVPLEKTLNEIATSWRGRKIAGHS